MAYGQVTFETVPLAPHQNRASKVGDVRVLLGPWTTSRQQLSSRCSW